MRRPHRCLPVGTQVILLIIVCTKNLFFTFLTNINYFVNLYFSKRRRYRLQTICFIYFNVFWVYTQVCYWWLWFYGGDALAPPFSPGATLQHRRPVVVDPLQAVLARGRVLGQSQQMKSSPVQDGQAADQEGSDTLGVNFGVGIGLAETPLIDSLLERLWRRKQLLNAAVAAYAPSWGAAGSAGYYPNPAAIYPYAGAGVFGGVGGGGGGGLPWNRPAVYPYPSFGPPSINPFGGFGVGGGGGGIGWGFGGIGGAFNPFDYDDFGFRGNGNNNGYNNGYNNGNHNNNGNNNGN